MYAWRLRGARLRARARALRHGGRLLRWPYVQRRCLRGTGLHGGAKLVPDRAGLLRWSRLYVGKPGRPPQGFLWRLRTSELWVGAARLRRRRRLLLRVGLRRGSLRGKDVHTSSRRVLDERRLLLRAGVHGWTLRLARWG